MTPTRRTVLRLVAGTLLARPAAARAAARAPLKAVVFDAFPIFDPRPIAALAETLFGARGEALARDWRTRQFEYGWLRALMGRYADFWQVSDEALTVSAAQLGLTLTADRRAQLMQAQLALAPWPDVAPTLDALARAGVRLAILSNLAPHMLAALTRSGLADRFEAVLSTDAVRRYKPDPRAYRLAVDALGLARNEIAFAAFAGWDAAGAASFGYPTVWVNRLAQPAEALGATPDASGPDLATLVEFVRRRAG